MNRSTPGLSVHHQILEFTLTHVHWVGDTIQPSHPLSSPSPLALNLSQHQGLFKWVSFSHQVAKVLEFQLSVTKSCTTLYDPMGCSMPGLPIPRCLPEFVQSVIFISCLQPFPASGSFLSLAVQETLKSLLQHHSSKASILQCYAFLMVQLSHLYMTTTSQCRAVKEAWRKTIINCHENKGRED